MNADAAWFDGIDHRGAVLVSLFEDPLRAGELKMEMVFNQTGTALRMELNEDLAIRMAQSLNSWYNGIVSSDIDTATDLTPHDALRHGTIRDHRGWPV